MITCLWQTADDWATLTGNDVSIFDGVQARSGPAYVRVCTDGTVWINETLALTITGALP